MNKYVKKEIEFAGRKLVLETGELAMSANMAVKASYGDTVLLATVVAGEPNPDIDFFPLSVHYEEKLYASGLIKGSRFVKRDGRPTDDAIITKRLIDHAIRPLFPSDYMDEVQVIVTILSLDEDADAVFLAMNAVSATLQASTVPWAGKMASVRVGYKDENYILNPSHEQLHHDSDLDMMVSFVGDEKRFLGLESESNLLTEEKILGAIEFARDNLDPVLSLVKEFVEEVSPDGEKYEYVSKAVSEELLKAVKDIAEEEVINLVRTEQDKKVRKEKLGELLTRLLTELEGKFKKSEMNRAFSLLEKKAVQHLILEEGSRPDGRAEDEVRAISSKVRVLPRPHGSAVFTRGVTQALTVATLGSPSLELLVQDLYGERSKRYMHYYNFPPFCTGETGRRGSPKSREIGHGMLAEKALRPVIPSQKEFPYTILLVSEILSSSGSSSMASTCGSSLALMDAGVPIKGMVAGIAIGLVVNEDMSKYRILTDIQGMEDAFGFLDFKMTGTREGVTAIQVDTKAKGLPMEWVPEILRRSKKARLHILDEMEKTIQSPRDDVAENAPKVRLTTVPVDKIGSVIGGGGKTIKELQESTGTEIHIEDDGSIMVSAVNAQSAEKAIEMIEALVKDIEVGEVYDGTIKEILDFGALVEILPGKVGLMHISEVSAGFVETLEGMFKPGDSVRVKVIETSRDGKISLSKRALETPEGEYRPNKRPRSGGRDGGRRGGRGSSYGHRR